MDAKKLLAVIVAGPILALFVAAAFVGVAIGENWTEATTAALVTGLVTVCGGGAVVVGLILSIVVGFPFAIRLMGDAGAARRTWVEAPPPSYHMEGPRRPALPWREERPPLPDARGDGGQWLSPGPGAYDLWEEPDNRFEGDFDDRFARR